MKNRSTMTWMGALVLAISCAAAAPVLAGDYDGNFMIRLQGTYLDTQDKTKSATANSGATDLSVPGYSARASNEVLPTATLTYFFNKNLSAELFCCFATANVDLLLNGSNQGQVAKTWMFPPAVTLQYHFTDMGAFKPYVGAGVQWIHYFNSSTGQNLLGATSASFTDSFGPVLQAGFDYKLGGGWYLNADVKKSWLDTKVSLTNTAALGNVSVKHSVDPLVISTGIGYRFNLEDLFGRRPNEPLK